MFKVNNKNTRTRCEICLKLKYRHQIDANGDVLVIARLNLVVLLLTVTNLTYLGVVTHFTSNIKQI